MAAEAEEEEIVAGEDAVDQLGEDGVAVADDSGEELFAGLELVDDVAAELVFDGAGAVAGFFELADGCGTRMTHVGMIGERGLDGLPVQKKAVETRRHGGRGERGARTEDGR